MATISCRRHNHRSSQHHPGPKLQLKHMDPTRRTSTVSPLQSLDPTRSSSTVSPLQSLDPTRRRCTVSPLQSMDPTRRSSTVNLECLRTRPINRLCYQRTPGNPRNTLAMLKVDWVIMTNIKISSISK